MVLTGSWQEQSNFLKKPDVVNKQCCGQRRGGIGILSGMSKGAMLGQVSRLLILISNDTIINPTSDKTIPPERSFRRISN
jgi:hypothetical protein